MPRRSKNTRAVLRTIQRSERRSTLFWWFVENHDEVQKAAQAARIDWTSFCSEAAKRGLTDTRGRRPTERNARETWRQARRAVSEARSQEAAQGPPRKGSVYPSRLPKDWRPQLALAAPQSGAGPTDPDKPYDPLERIAEIRRDMKARSGRKE
jgi:hypothetical protein